MGNPFRQRHGQKYKFFPRTKFAHYKSWGRRESFCRVEKGFICGAGNGFYCTSKRFKTVIRIMILEGVGVIGRVREAKNPSWEFE